MPIPSSKWSWFDLTAWFLRRLCAEAVSITPLMFCTRYSHYLRVLSIRYSVCTCLCQYCNNSYEKMMFIQYLLALTTPQVCILSVCEAITSAKRTCKHNVKSHYFAFSHALFRLHGIISHLLVTNVGTRLSK